jgi:uncharacterized protein with FMN-binding domain
MKKEMKLVRILCMAIVMTMMISNLYLTVLADNQRTIYEGNGTGFNGNIKVSVTLSDNKIQEIKVLEHKEDSPLLPAVTEALFKIPQKIIEKQLIDVDVVTAATYTSKGIINAVKNALKGTIFDDTNSIQAQWQEIGRDPSKEGTHVLTFGKKILFIQKSNGKSMVSLRNEAGQWQDKLLDLPEVDTAFANGHTGYIAGNKNGPYLYYTTDGGNAWTDLIGEGKKYPAEISGKKIAAMYAEENDIYIVVESLGIFYSADGASTWTKINGNIPKVRNAYNLINIYKYKEKLYVGSSTLGLFVSDRGDEWRLINESQGLPNNNSKNIGSVAFLDDKIFAATNGGVFQTVTDAVYSPEQNKYDTWQKVDGMTSTEQVKGITVLDGKIYTTSRYDKNMYYLDSQGVLRAFGNKPNDLAINQLNYVTNDGEYLIVLHTTGLLKVKPWNTENTLDSVIDNVEENGIKKPYVNCTNLDLPVVPIGYAVRIFSSDDEEVISVNGDIRPQQVEKNVNIVLEVMNTKSGLKKLTKEICVTVPAKGIGKDDGIYEGVGTGYRGTIKVRVVVGNDRIQDIKIVEHREDTITWPEAGVAAVTIPKKIIEGQKISVDAVTSATFTSKGIMQALGKALKGTAFSKEDPDYIELISDGETGSLVYRVGENVIYISSENNRSDVVVIKSDGTFETKLKGLNFIESGYVVPGTDNIYLMGQRRGSIIAESKDAGLTWTTQGSAGLGNVKSDSLVVMPDETMFASMNGQGVYRSVYDSVYSSVYNQRKWESVSDTLPIAVGRTSGYDTNKIKYLNGTFWVSTRGQGLFKSKDGKQWASFNSNGLTELGKNIVDFDISKNILYIATGDGVWKISMEDGTAWQKVPGYNGLAAGLTKKNDNIFMLTDNPDIYRINKAGLTKITDIPPYIAVQDGTSLCLDDEHFYISHRYGLIKIKIPVITSEEENDNGKNIKDGVYNGVGYGYNGAIGVKVTVLSGKISSVEVSSHNETTSMNVVTQALTLIPQRIVQSQKLDVDTVSGATLTSKAIINGAKNALAGTSFSNGNTSIPETIYKFITIFPTSNDDDTSDDTKPVETDEAGEKAKDPVELVRSKIPGYSGDLGYLISNDRIIQEINSNKTARVIDIFAKEDGQVLDFVIESDGLKSLKEKNVSLRINYKKGYYLLPSDLKIIYELENDLGNIKRLALKLTDIDKVKYVENSLKFIVDPVEFKLNAQFEKGEREITHFGSQLIERQIVIGDYPYTGLNAVVYENGAWKPVLTKFKKENGKTLALVSNNVNGIYAVVTKAKVYKDMINHWSKDVVEELSSKLILNGIGDEFQPDSLLTRAQYTVMLIRNLGIKLKSSNGITFTDVKKGSWYEEDIIAAAGAGLISGYPDGSFKPDKGITREEMTVVAMKMLDYIRSINIDAAYSEDANKALPKTAVPSAVLTKKWKNGEYKASAMSYGGELELLVKVEGDKIKSASIAKINDTPGYGDLAVKEMIKRIIKKQSIDVDTITTATISCNAAKKAVSDALLQAGDALLKEKELEVQQDKNEEDASVSKEEDTAQKPATNEDVKAFLDEESFNEWARNAIYSCYRERILNGFPDGNFYPGKNSTRAEAASLIKNLRQSMGY